jgi:hypothetical protein
MPADYTAPCSSCGVGLKPTSLVCPGCSRLTRSSELQALFVEARRAEAAGELAASRDLWERAEALLPSDTVQYRSVQGRIVELDRRLVARRDSHLGFWRRAGAAVGPVALIAWKLKALLLGFTKISTLLSIFAFFGVYWSLYGWPFALGLVLSI